MSNCPSYFPASCSNCSGSSSGTCNCGYIIERYDSTYQKWKTLVTKCDSNCSPPMAQSALAYSYGGMCRLRCCVPSVQGTRSLTRTVLYIAAAVTVVALIYWILRMLVFSETAP